MNLPARRLDIVTMTSATHQAADHAADTIARATRLQADPEREKRIEAGLCRWCHYAAGRVGGASMTTQPCAACGVKLHFCNTNTDALCPPCAKEHSLCKRCGGDRETRTLRRKWPTFCPPTPAVEVVAHGQRVCGWCRHFGGSDGAYSCSAGTVAAHWFATFLDSKTGVLNCAAEDCPGFVEDADARA